MNFLEILSSIKQGLWPNIGNVSFPGTTEFEKIALQGGKTLISQAFKKLSAASATSVLAATALVATSAVVTTGITNPDSYRCLTVKGSAATVVGNAVVTGTDWSGNVITETFVLSGASAISGKKPFKTVTSVALPPKVAASGETVSVGLIDVFGIIRNITDPTDVLRVTHKSGQSEFAKLVIGTAAAKNKIGLIAKTTGVTLVNLTITLADAADESLAVNVSSNDITVALKTDAEKVNITTAAEVVAALKASSPAAALATFFLLDDVDGTGIVQPLTKTVFPNGVNASSAAVKFEDPAVVSPRYDTVTPISATIAGEDMIIDFYTAFI